MPTLQSHQDSLEGPPLPPMSDHLTNTPIANLRNLLVHVIAAGMGDDQWVHSKQFALYCAYIGMEPCQVRAIREMTVAGTLPTKRVANIFLGAHSGA